MHNFDVPKPSEYGLFIYLQVTFAQQASQAPAALMVTSSPEQLLANWAMRPFRNENDPTVDAVLADEMALFARLAAAHVPVLTANITGPLCHISSSGSGILPHLVTRSVLTRPNCEQNAGFSLGFRKLSGMENQVELYAVGSG